MYSYKYNGELIPTPVQLGDWVFQDVLYAPTESDSGYIEVSKDEVFSGYAGIAFLSITHAKITSFILYGVSPSPHLPPVFTN